MDEDKFSGLSSGGVAGGADELVVTETMPLTAAETAAVDEDAALTAADLAEAIVAFVADPIGS